MSSRKRLTKYHGDSAEHVWPAENLPRPTVAKRTPAKKNTKLWCKGKVGREHVLVFKLASWNGAHCQPTEHRSWWASRRQNDEKWICYHREVCDNCGKVLEAFLPSSRCPDRPAS